MAQERFDMGTFWHEEFLARGIFGTETYRHGDILAHYTTMKSIIPSLNIFDWEISFEFLNFLIQNVADKQRNFSRIFQDWIISFRKADKLIVFLKNKTPLEYTLYQTISDKDEILFRWSKSEKQISSAQRPPPLVAILLKIWESKAGFNNDCLGIMNLLPIFHIKIIIKLSTENFYFWGCIFHIFQGKTITKLSFFYIIKSELKSWLRDNPYTM